MTDKPITVASNVTDKPKSVASTLRRTFKGKQTPRQEIHVVKLRHIPYGFFEKEILKYFRQFGKVLRVRVARSKKTGNHKGWAYVGFNDPDVAQIAAESMNGYLMFEKRVMAEVLKPENVPDHMKRGDTLRPPPIRYHTVIKEAEQQWKVRTPEEDQKLKKRRMKLKKACAQRLLAMGINYSLPDESANEVPHDVIKVVDTQKNISKGSPAAPGPVGEKTKKKKRSLDKQNKSNQALDSSIQVIEESQPIKKRKSDGAIKVQSFDNNEEVIEKTSKVETPKVKTPKDKTLKNKSPAVQDKLDQALDSSIKVIKKGQPIKKRKSDGAIKMQSLDDDEEVIEKTSKVDTPKVKTPKKKSPVVQDKSDQALDTSIKVIEKSQPIKKRSSDGVTKLLSFDDDDDDEEEVMEKPTKVKTPKNKSPAVQEKHSEKKSHPKTPVMLTPKAKTPKSTTPIARRANKRLTPARIAHKQKEEAKLANGKEPSVQTPKTPRNKGTQGKTPTGKAQTPSRQTPSRQGKHN